MFCVGNKRPATEHAAVWVPDSEAQTCMHCLKVKFTPIQRRVSSVTTPFLFPSFVSLCLSSLNSLSFSLSPSLSLFLSPFLPPSLPPFLLPSPFLLSTTVGSVVLWCVAGALIKSLYYPTSLTNRSESALLVLRYSVMPLPIKTSKKKPFLNVFSMYSFISHHIWQCVPL